MEVGVAPRSVIVPEHDGLQSTRTMVGCWRDGSAAINGHDGHSVASAQRLSPAGTRTAAEAE